MKIENVWQVKDLQARFLDVWQLKELQEDFSDVWQGKDLADWRVDFTEKYSTREIGIQE